MSKMLQAVLLQQYMIESHAAMCSRMCLACRHCVAGCQREVVGSTTDWPCLSLTCGSRYHWLISLMSEWFTLMSFEIIND